MNILESFYIQFKTNADDVKRGTKEAEKAVNELDKGIKNTNEETEKLGKSFVKMLEGGAQALTAVLSFGAIKAGVMNAAQFNSNLEVQAKLLGQNVTDLKAYGAAVEAAGGSVEGFQGSVRGAFNAASQAGLPLPPVDVLMRRYRDAIKGLSKNEQARRLGMLGVSDPGMIALLEQSDEEFEKSITSAREHAAVTEKDTAAAREFEKAWSGAAHSLDTLFSKIGSDVLPPLTSLLNIFTDFTSSLKDNKAAMYGFFAAMITLSITAAGTVAKLAGSLLGLGGAMASVMSRLSIAGAVTAGLPFIANGAWKAGNYIGTQLNKALGRGDANGIIGGAPQDPKEAMSFWMSQGFSREQAAGIVANEQRESSGNPSAIGDSGAARGLYQWHPHRRAQILAATGIDVSTANATDQRRAALWEMKNTGLYDDLKNTSTPDQAAGLFSRQFERPANGDVEAIKRGQMALGIASSSAFSTNTQFGGDSNSSRNTNVKIDQISVNTQATDAQGISSSISQELTSHLRTTVSNYDDGVAY